MAYSTSQLRTIWSPACAGDHITIPFGDQGARIRVERVSVPAWRHVEAVMAAHDYEIRKGVTGSYNCRVITGGRGYSLHAFAIATDVNWDRNPYSRTLQTDMTREMVDEILALETNNGKRVFRWGGDFSSVKDAMHFEIVCRPEDLATGLANALPPVEHDEADEPATLTEDSEPEFTVPDDDRSYLQEWDKGPRVVELQELLNEVANAGLEADGYYGEVTEEAVTRYQHRHDLEVDGLAGEETLGHLREAKEAAEKRDPILRLGSKDAEVRKVQETLRMALGRDVAVDGAFGPQTAEAVADLQSLRGIKRDSVVGPATWAELRTARKIAKVVPPRLSRPVRLVKPYTSHRSIRAWQSQMIERGWNLGPWGADGTYGPTSEKICRAFQKEFSDVLAVDGVLGGETYMAAWVAKVR